MSKNDFEFILLKDEHGVKSEKDLIEYEKKLYQSFTKDETNDWILKNYIIIDNYRFRPPIPYDDIFIAVVKKNNEIIVGVSGHYNINNEYQLEKMGFKLSNKQNTCEGLNYFTTKNLGEKFIYVFDYLFKNLIEILKKKNIKTFYLTTSDRSLNMYELFGFKIAEEIIKNNKKKYLLMIDIN